MRLGKFQRLCRFLFLKEDRPSSSEALELCLERKLCYIRNIRAHFLADKKAVNAASEQWSSQIYSRRDQMAGSAEDTWNRTCTLVSEEAANWGLPPWGNSLPSETTWTQATSFPSVRGVWGHLHLSLSKLPICLYKTCRNFVILKPRSLTRGWNQTMGCKVINERMNNLEVNVNTDSQE